jgi:hypothetical protein
MRWSDLHQEQKKEREQKKRTKRASARPDTEYTNDDANDSSEESEETETVVDEDETSAVSKKECPEIHEPKVPKSSADEPKFVLRVGDEIRYKSYWGNELIDATIKEIEPPKTDDDIPEVTTTSMKCIIANCLGDGTFTLLKSIHADAPPLGEPMEFSDVILCVGKLQRGEEDRRKSMDKAIEETAGGLEMAALSHATQAARKKFLRRQPGDETDDQLDSPVKKNPEDKTVDLLDSPKSGIPPPSIGDVGYKMKKLFDAGWFDGEVIDIRHINKVQYCQVLYSDDDREELTVHQLEVLFADAQKHEETVEQEVNKIVRKILKEKETSGTIKVSVAKKYVCNLPFLPRLTPLHVLLADKLRDKKFIVPATVMKVIEGNQIKRIPGTLYALKGEQLDMERAIDPKDQDTEQWGCKRRVYPVAEKCIKSLHDSTYVFDDVVAAIVRVFNYREYRRGLDDPGYKCSIMISNHWVDLMCFKVKRSTSGRKEYSCIYLPNELCDRLTTKVGEDKINAGVDIFSVNVNWIIFPWNIGNWHWAFFVVNPKSLEQRFYDSLNGNLDAYTHADHVSQCIHKWVKDYHRLRTGEDHLLHETEWSRELIEDDQKRLKTNIQTGVDCALYTVTQPFIIQDGLDLDVLGKTEEARKQAGIELRRRVMLSVFFGDSYLDPNPSAIHGIVCEEKVARLKSLNDDGKGKSAGGEKKGGQTAD